MVHNIRLDDITKDELKTSLEFTQGKIAEYIEIETKINSFEL